MTAYKKRKIEDECRVFNEEWTGKYYFTKVGIKAICLLYGESVAVFKEYNKKTQPNQACKLGTKFHQRRKQKCQELVNKLRKQQRVFIKQSIIQDAATEASFLFHTNLQKETSRFQMVGLSKNAGLM